MISNLFRSRCGLEPLEGKGLKGNRKPGGGKFGGGILVKLGGGRLVGGIFGGGILRGGRLVSAMLGGGILGGGRLGGGMFGGGIVRFGSSELVWLMILAGGGPIFGNGTLGPVTTGFGGIPSVGGRDSPMGSGWAMEAGTVGATGGTNAENFESLYHFLSPISFTICSLMIILTRWYRHCEGRTRWNCRH